MLPLRMTVSISIVGLGAVLGGCASAGPNAMNFSVRKIDGLGHQVILERAEAALVDMGYEVSHKDINRGILAARARKAPTIPRARRSSRARLSTQGESRKIVEIRVVDSPEGINLYCRALLQEQTTEAFRLFDRDSFGQGDVPNATPIERDAATTREQNTVWRTVSRERMTERAILASVAEEKKLEPAHPETSDPNRP